MQETRRMRLQSAIQEELSQFVAREVKDPRIPYVTFTEVQVTQDGSHATIFVSILGGTLGLRDREGVEPLSEEAAERAARIRVKDCLDGLQAAQGFIRRHLGKVLNVRHIPTLAFREDRGFENAARVHELLFKLEDGAPKAGTAAVAKPEIEEEETEEEES